MRLGEVRTSRLKIERARHHVGELARSASQFLSSKPYSIRTSEEPPGDLVYRVSVAKAVPDDWGLVVGDAVHNLRAALDHLAWALVEVSGGTPSRDTCFPIAMSQTAIAQSLPRALAGARPEVLAFARRLKPYRGGNVHLDRIHSLDIVDKHRLPLIAGAAHKNIVMKLLMNVPWREDPIKIPSIALRPSDRQFPLSDGAEVFRIREAARGMSMEEPGFTFELAFGEPGELNGLPMIQTLEAAVHHVDRIVSIAERRLT